MSKFDLQRFSAYEISHYFPSEKDDDWVRWEDAEPLLQAFLDAIEHIKKLQVLLEKHQIHDDTYRLIVKEN
jgi:hypothetical protein